MNPLSRSRLVVVLLAAASLVVGCRAPASTPGNRSRTHDRAATGRAGRRGRRFPNATSVRLLETQARSHIGRRVLHRLPDGEVTEDPVWLWTSTPDRYLDSALRLAIASSPDIRLVDASTAASLAVTCGPGSSNRARANG